MKYFTERRRNREVQETNYNEYSDKEVQEISNCRGNPDKGMSASPAEPELHL